MGIRCYCPNGHRLHLKSFLAGKRGICPHCETRFVIPFVSESRRRPVGAEGAIPRGAQERASGIAPEVGSPVAVAEEPAADLLGEDGQETGIVVDEARTGTRSESQGHRLVALLDSPVPARSETWSGTDPITEAPDAVWYVRPPSGGQFGPARGDIFRRWLDEGRVTPDSLVWREGWADWSQAGLVFSAPTTTYTGRAVAEPSQDASLPSPSIQAPLRPAIRDSGSERTRPAGRPAPVARPSKSPAAVIILGVLVVVLLVVLVLVVTARG